MFFNNLKTNFPHNQSPSFPAGCSFCSPSSAGRSAVGRYCCCQRRPWLLRRMGRVLQVAGQDQGGRRDRGSAEAKGSFQIFVGSSLLPLDIFSVIFVISKWPYLAFVRDEAGGYYVEPQVSPLKARLPQLPNFTKVLGSVETKTLLTIKSNRDYIEKCQMWFCSRPTSLSLPNITAEASCNQRPLSADIAAEDILG